MVSALDHRACFRCAALAASLETNPTEAAVLDAIRLLREPEHLSFFP